MNKQLYEIPYKSGEWYVFKTNIKSMSGKSLTMMKRLDDDETLFIPWYEIKGFKKIS